MKNWRISAASPRLAAILHTPYHGLFSLTLDEGQKALSECRMTFPFNVVMSHFSGGLFFFLPV